MYCIVLSLYEIKFDPLCMHLALPSFDWWSTQTNAKGINLDLYLHWFDHAGFSLSNESHTCDCLHSQQGVGSIGSMELLFVTLKAHTGARLAKIDLVTIFDCDHPWYCTIDYVIVNYIGIHHLFHHIQWFLAINHLWCIIHAVIAWGEHSSVLDLLLTMLEVPGTGLISGHGICFQFWYTTMKRGRQLVVCAKSLIQQ